MTKLRFMLANVFLAASCASGASTTVSDSTTAPIITVGSTTTAPAPTPPTDPTTTAVSTQPPPATTTTQPAPVLPTSCAWSTPSPGGTVTFVAADRLYELAPDGSIRCLVDVRPDETGPIRWSPDATRVLLGGSTVAGDFGRRASGYFATNPDVTWSAPTGKALIAPSVDNGSLVWRNSSDANDRLDVSFLADTVAAAYHPAGKAIAAIGIDEAGATALYLATNRGKNPKQLAFVEDPADTDLTELTFNALGTVIYFLHDHGASYHVHQLFVAGIQLTDVVEEAGDADHLVASTLVDGSVAWRRWVGGASTVRASFAFAALTTYPASEPDATVEPVGWLQDELVVLETPAGSAATDGTLWAWSGAAPPRRLTVGASRAAVRIERGGYLELPDDITQAAVG